jgi:hypothetical protein
MDAKPAWKRVYYLRSDGEITRVDSEGQAAMLPGAGLTYLGLATALDKGVLLRSDGVLVVFALNGETPGSVVGSVRLRLPAGRAAVKVAAGGYSAAVIDSAGDAWFYSIDDEHPLDRSQAMFQVPKPPKGVRYVDAFVASLPWLWQASWLVRSDGSVMARGEAPFAAAFPGDMGVIRPPKGVKYTGFGHSAWWPVVFGSDGSARSVLMADPCGDPPTYTTCGPTVPNLPKGWVFVDGSSAGGESLLYGVARVPAGVRASSSVVEVVAPARGVVKGEPAVVRVRLGSRDWLRGGKVVVRSGGKVVGKATVGGSSLVKVKVATGGLSASKVNRLSVQYLGNGYSTKSYRVGFTLKIRDR